MISIFFLACRTSTAILFVSVSFVFLLSTHLECEQLEYNCLSYLPYPVRWQVIALSTLLTALQCSTSVSCFCDRRACISLGGKIGTGNRCAGCRRVRENGLM